MADYRTPLPGLLADLLETAINRALALDPASAERLERVEGKTLQLDLEGLAITLYLDFAYGAVEVSLDCDDEPAARVSGTPVALFNLAAPDDMGDWGLPGSGVRIEGDATLARDLGKIFSALDPDWRSPLTGIFGDVLGHQVAEGLKQGLSGLRAAAQNSLAMTGRFLNEESDVLAPQHAIDSFNREVDDLRDDLDRFEARLARAERKRADAEES